MGGVRRDPSNRAPALTRQLAPIPPTRSTGGWWTGRPATVPPSTGTVMPVICAAFAGQEQDSLGDVTRRALTLQRLVESDHRAQVVGRDAGRDVARGDAIHPHAVLGQIGGDDPAEHDDGRFGRAVGDREAHPP